jgi:hypothetical protein
VRSMRQVGCSLKIFQNELPTLEWPTPSSSSSSLRQTSKGTSFPTKRSDFDRENQTFLSSDVNDIDLIIAQIYVYNQNLFIVSTFFFQLR